MNDTTQPMTMQMDGNEIARMEAIIQSMTAREREDPSLIEASRRRRIARGSGTNVEEINRLLKQFEGMQKMFKNVDRFKLELPVPAGMYFVEIKSKKGKALYKIVKE